MSSFVYLMSQSTLEKKPQIESYKFLERKKDISLILTQTIDLKENMAADL